MGVLWRSRKGVAYAGLPEYFHFDETRRKLTYLGDCEWQTARISYRITDTCSWTIKLSNIRSNANIALGICQENAKLAGFVGCDSFGWGFFGNSKMAVWHDGHKVKTGYGAKFKNGDEVQVTIDIERQELSFAINGVDYGAAFHKIDTSKPLYPAISMYNPDDRVELLEAWIYPAPVYFSEYFHVSRGLKWSCPVCTYLNRVRSPRCDMCDAEQPRHHGKSGRFNPIELLSQEKMVKVQDEPQTKPQVKVVQEKTHSEALSTDQNLVVRRSISPFGFSNRRKVVPSTQSIAHDLLEKNESLPSPPSSPSGQMNRPNTIALLSYKDSKNSDQMSQMVKTPKKNAPLPPIADYDSHSRVLPPIKYEGKFASGEKTLLSQHPRFLPKAVNKKPKKTLENLRPINSVGSLQAISLPHHMYRFSSKRTDASPNTPLAAQLEAPFRPQKEGIAYCEVKISNASQRIHGSSQVNWVNDAIPGEKLLNDLVSEIAHDEETETEEKKCDTDEFMGSLVVGGLEKLERMDSDISRELILKRVRSESSLGSVTISRNLEQKCVSEKGVPIAIGIATNSFGLDRTPGLVAHSYGKKKNILYFCP